MPSLAAVYNVRVVRSVVLGSTASLVGFCLSLSQEQLFVQHWDMMMPSLTAVYNVRVVRSVVLGSTASLVGSC